MRPAPAAPLPTVAARGVNGPGRIPMQIVLAALVLASAASCGIAFAAESYSGECLPTGAALAADATLGAAAGAYRLTMVGGRPGEAPRSASASLVLAPSTFGADAFAPSSNPLAGATDIDLRAVGAFPVGDPASRDPAAPGVIVLESRQGNDARILLRLGADANRPDSPLFDGGYAVLEVREITAAGFAGDWRSAADGTMASGHFCARRL